jgi:hypothetical protein
MRAGWLQRLGPSILGELYDTRRRAPRGTTALVSVVGTRQLTLNGIELIRLVPVAGSVTVTWSW